MIKKISQEIFDTGNVEDQSLAETIRHFESTADALQLSNLMFEHWMKPPIFEDAKEFFETCPVPIYIVSNIDKDDILRAIEFHHLKSTGVFTSEDAKSYKPRKELFELALNSTGLSAEQVVHIGDSMSSDVKGASSLGINAIWVNQSGRAVPDGVISVGNLLEVYDIHFFRQNHLGMRVVGEIVVNIQYRKLAAEDLDRFIEMRICQLREEGAREYGCGVVQITASDMGVLLYSDFGFVKNGNFMQYRL